MKKFKSISLILAGIFILVITNFSQKGRSEVLEFEQGVNVFEKGLSREREQLHKELYLVLSKLDTTSKLSLFEAFSQRNKKSNSFYCYQESDLIAWSGNNNDVLGLSSFEGGIKKLHNAWYIVEKEKIGSYSIYGLSLISIKYPVQNDYLVNGIQEVFGLNEHWVLSKDSSNTAHSKLIVASQGNNSEYNVYLQLERESDHLYNNAMAILELLSLLLIGWGIVLLSKFGLVFQLVATAFLLIIRVALLFTSALVYLKEGLLFSPRLYAESDWLPSFGDFSLHVAAFFLLAFVWKQSNKGVERNPKVLTVIAIIGSVSVFYFAYVLIYLIRSVIDNSQISLNINNFESVDVYTVLSLVLLGVLFALLSDFVTQSVKLCFTSMKPRTVTLLYVTLTVASYFVFPANGFSLVHWMWIIPLCFIAIYKSQNEYQGHSFVRYLPELLIFSFLLAFFVESKNDQLITNKVEHLLSKKSQERDPIAEYLLSEISKELQLDTNLFLYHAQALEQYYINNYDNKYLNRFDLQIAKDSINTSKSKLVKSESVGISENLSQKLIDGNMSYQIIVSNDHKQIQVSFSSKEIPTGAGFPLLLASKSMSDIAFGHEFSYAKYRNGKIVDQKGDFDYPTSHSVFLMSDSTARKEIAFRGFRHVLLNKNNNVYVVGVESKSLSTFVSRISYFLVLFGMLLFLLTSINRVRKEGLLLPSDFRSRLQYSILFLLFFSTIILAYGSIHFLKEQYNKEAFEAITEKVKSVERTLNKEGEGYIQQKDEREIKSMLNELSATFFTDVILYDRQGSLLSSSEENIFKEGLLSSQINPVAYQNIYLGKAPSMVQIEKISTMSYLSAYVPILDEQGNMRACLNLPYFAKTDELKREINRFLMTFINMYLLLTLLSLGLALLISNRITRPLKIIKDKIANLSLSNENETIQWETKDEIGALVEEYNRMVSELSKKAALLVEAEREGAWKEMAQQVAHEIKNPLTPMKLNLQHMQMRWSGMEEEEKNGAMKNLSESLVHQIDVLSEIATEFSAFGEMSELKVQELDLVPIVNSAVELYDGTENIHFSLDVQESEINIQGDKDQLIRILNNLIKNAMQAIPEGNEGRINVGVSSFNSKVTVAIADNGTGIPEELIEKIFQPKFTTKTSGKGLGLAMVKKMVESIEGEIWFESKPDAGTTFFLSFPIL